MSILVGLSLAACLFGTLVALVVRRRRPAFPPVVELAQTSSLPRLGFRLAVLTARGSGAQRPTEREVPAQVSVQVPEDVAEAGQETTGDHVALHPASGPSVYEVSKSPYAAPVVRGSRITLPEDANDLPIKFRSEHPNARAIATAGDQAEHLQITGTDGRIHLGEDAPVHFGPPAD